ncbi:hypothetical protein GFL95_31965 [Rhizobium leguminosarum bv. viciae]|uniref:hypothetical protein n=1 Tax=Rhizobium leguminosarum TaxID=384 RepID=UPI00144255AF|nr:hypothetical protein [Rhizobium leguminosarum]NKK95771.1 hypothetical protein [Rhizobium leguminosarum bv. viciae]
MITAVQFNLQCGIQDIHPDIEQMLRACVKEAVKRKDQPSEHFLSTQVRSIPQIPLAHYRGRNWYSGPLTNGQTEIGISVRGFDDADLRHEFGVRLVPLMDALSCMTNVAFEEVHDREGAVSARPEDANQFLVEEDWLDDFPMEDHLLRLSAAQLRFCEDLVEERTGDNRLARAASIFHKAMGIYRNLPEAHDVAMALFVSALESVDLPLSNPASCPTCSQPTYKISQRVVDLGRKHLGQGVERIFKESYQRRSKYLHAGKVVASQPVTSHFIPQLDPDGIEGCAMPSAAGNPKNLMEFTSFVIRREMLFSDQSVHGHAVAGSGSPGT